MTESEPLLLVLDGSGIVCRAVASCIENPLITSTGVDSGGLFRTLDMFNHYVRIFRPTHVLWTMDNGRSVYRSGLLPTYKANRDDRKPSIPKRELSETYKHLEIFLHQIDCRWISEPGVEADDLIASACKNFASPELPVCVVSSDHDMRQLVSDDVCVYVPQNYGQATLYDVEKTEAKYGVPIRLLSSLWALQGDPGDNLIGVKGVGEKTAAKMLNRWGSLESALANEEKLDGWGRQVLLNRRLIDLDGTIAEFDVSLESCEFKIPPDIEKIRALLEHFEFASYLKQLEQGIFLNY